MGKVMVKQREFVPELVFRSFYSNPNVKLFVSPNTWMEMTFKRTFVEGRPEWYVVAYLWNRNAKKWHFGVASPWSKRDKKTVCMWAVIWGIAEELGIK